MLIVGLIVLAVLAFGGGYLLAKDGGGSSPSPSPTRTRSPKPTKEPTVTPSPSASASASTSASASPSGSPVLEDGRHFVYPKDASASGTWSLTFDLAYFYTDEDAIRECGPDVPNGYCIVNDNPTLRTLPVSRSVAVRYIPVDACCALKPGNFPSFADAVEAGTQTDLRPHRAVLDHRARGPGRADRPNSSCPEMAPEAPRDWNADRLRPAPDPHDRLGRGRGRLARPRRRRAGPGRRLRHRAR